MAIQFQPHQQRVVDEHKELTEKLNKLRDFLKSDFYKGANIANSEKQLLSVQADAMGMYSNILAARIELFIANEA